MRFRLLSILSLAVAVCIVCSCVQDKERRYYDTGELKSFWNYEHDTLTGTKTLLWPNGIVKVRYSYLNGKLHGPYEGFYENGFKARQSTFSENLLIGKALRFFSDSSSLLQRETYFLNVLGQQSMYYDKEFDRNGQIIREDRSVFVGFDCTDVLPLATLSFVAAFPFDSVYVITGAFKNDFSIRETQKSDTLKIRNGPVHVMLNKENTDERFFRGKCVFFNGTVFGDSTRMDIKTRYFEEKLSDRCYERIE